MREKIVFTNGNYTVKRLSRPMDDQKLYLAYKNGCEEEAEYANVCWLKVLEYTTRMTRQEENK